MPLDIYRFEHDLTIKIWGNLFFSDNPSDAAFVDGAVSTPCFSGLADPESLVMSDSCCIQCLLFKYE